MQDQSLQKETLKHTFFFSDFHLQFLSWFPNNNLDVVSNDTHWKRDEACVEKLTDYNFHMVKLVKTSASPSSNTEKMSKRKQEEASLSDSSIEQKKTKSEDVAAASSSSDDENPILTKLKTLDQSSEFKTIKEFEDAFASVTDYLFNQTELVVKDKTYRLAEVEYYYTCPPVHNDPFSHCHDLQATKGEWYFHQSLAKTNDNNYKGGSYQGLDISIGCGKFRGGILIRSLLKSDGKTLIEGPSKCVDEIIETYDCKNIHDFVTKHFKGQKHFQALDTKSVFHLRPSTTTHTDTVVRSARVGLTLKQKTQEKERVQYIFRPYRFCLVPQKMKKGKHLICIILYKELQAKGEKDPIKKVETMTGSSGLAKYFKTYEAKSSDAFESVDKIDTSKLGDYSKDFTTQQIYELGGILKNIY